MKKVVYVLVVTVIVSLAVVGLALDFNDLGGGTVGTDNLGGEATNYGSRGRQTLTTMVVVNCDGYLNLRWSPEQVSGNIITTIPIGEYVYAAKYNSDWHYVEYGGYSGYSMSKYLQEPYLPDPDPTKKPTKYETKYVNVSGLQLRKKASSNAEAKCILRYGDVVSAKEYNESWYSVKTSDGYKGYVKKTYLSDYPVYADWADYEVITNGYSILYASGNYDADLKRTVDPGTVVTATRYNKDFYCVWTNGDYGYMEVNALYPVSHSQHYCTCDCECCRNCPYCNNSHYGEGSSTNNHYN